MSVLAGVWNLYLGLFSLIGHVLFVLIGIALCGYATAQQLEPLHDTAKDVMIFAVGLLLISFKAVRRVVWTFSGLAAPWGSLVWFVAKSLAEHDHSFRLTPELIAIAVVPPLLATLFLEAMSRNSTPDLEISLSKEPDGES